MISEQRLQMQIRELVISYLYPLFTCIKRVLERAHFVQQLESIEARLLRRIDELTSGGRGFKRVCTLGLFIF